jgi:hypothetical protein
MWISIKFTDVFPSNDWYWQILSFLIGLILAASEFTLLFMGIGILMYRYMSKYEKIEKKKAPRKYMMIIYVDFTIHGIFYLFTLLEVIQYITVHKYIRDIAIMGAGSTLFLIFHIYEMYFHDDRIGEGYYYSSFPYEKRRLP